ncbi:MAG: hypothetical protein Q8Q31_05470 [Nanoarchaeota archaeon]|nr:hypothetical protein [Nanoarchaeota archaeon]
MPIKIPKPDQGMEFWYELRKRELTLYERRESQSTDYGYAFNALEVLMQVSCRKGLERALLCALSRIEEWESDDPAKFVAYDLKSPMALFGVYNPRLKSFDSFQSYNPQRDAQNI